MKPPKTIWILKEELESEGWGERPDICNSSEYEYYYHGEYVEKLKSLLDMVIAEHHKDQPNIYNAALGEIARIEMEYE